MKFYVPEWEDAVDAHYDFIHDELSELDKTKRERHFIWDIFEYATTPIDGVLISREQVEDSQTRFDRVTEYGVYDDPQLEIPDWLPTISDCGAWGYKSLPFPRYGNEDMLEFYEMMDVTTGVTIDHLVLGSGKEKGRLYLDERAFHSDFTESDLPTELTDQVDVMIDEWPSDWPDFVDQHEPSIYDVPAVEPFTAEDFEGDVHEILHRVSEDPRAVYREDDKQERFEMTLENARDMRELYEAGEWSFRLMAAFQGWDPVTYGEAVGEVLDMGYQYVGVGGVAGSQLEQVEEIVREVGDRIYDYQSEQETRVDAHVFGFAKTDGFETIGRSGMSSIDSASMLRAAWTGGNNYHLDSEERYDAIRVRYGLPRDDLETAIEKSLHGQEVLHALRAYDDRHSVSTAIHDWYTEAESVLDDLVEYLEEHRYDEVYNRDRLREIEAAFRDEFEHGSELQASFSDEVRRRVIKLLRRDDENDPVDFGEYLDIIDLAREVYERYPRTLERVENLETESTDVGTFKHVWTVLKDYAMSEKIDDGDNLSAYRKTLRARPWERCECPICEDHGIEVAIFRGNNRNRRRGFHNMYRFYQQLDDDLPKILVVTRADSSFMGYNSVEEYLLGSRGELWTNVYDLPVAELAVVDANRVHEWWENDPESVSLDPQGIAAQLKEKTERYDAIFYYGPEEQPNFEIEGVQYVTTPKDVRDKVLYRLGYESDFKPSRNMQSHLGAF